MLSETAFVKLFLPKINVTEITFNLETLVTKITTDPEGESSNKTAMNSCYSDHRKNWCRSI